MTGLGRIVHFDERSRAYGIRQMLDAGPIARTARIWGIPDHFPLDQGQEGACVGFGWSAELASQPVMYNTTTAYAFAYYRAAQVQDRAMGNYYPEGASVLAGAKVAKSMGMVREYRWAFGIDDVVDTICMTGPVVLGLNWYESMYRTTRDGVVTVEGDIVGGHCITAIGYTPKHPRLKEPGVYWVNSWGKGYGINGVGFIREADLKRLLSEDGEACIATDVVVGRTSGSSQEAAGPR